MLRENHQQLEEEMGSERYRKEYACDMSVDIDLLADYLGEKLGPSKARVTATTDYSRMAEMKLDKDKVGWYVMMYEGQGRLKTWVDKIVASGELGALGDAPPDLLDELGLEPSDMDPSSEDPEDDHLGGVQVEVRAACTLVCMADCMLFQAREDQELPEMSGLHSSDGNVPQVAR